MLEGFQRSYLSAPPFILTSFQKVRAPSDTMVIYIEGDGYAWASRTVPSDDPTPRHPLAFDLATQDPSGIVVYLARPGQFDANGRPLISRDYWTGKRYSEEVIQATSTAIDSLKKSLGVTKVSLVGYSGGAAVAVLVAARRSDVVALRTVAGNLASDVFAQRHHVSPLKGSLDPVAVASLIRKVPQLHFVGDRDTIVPKSIAETFLEKEGYPGYKSLIEVKGADHLNGWFREWKNLLRRPLN